MTEIYKTSLYNEHLADYYMAKRWLNSFRNKFIPVLQTMRGFSLAFLQAFTIGTLRYLPYVGTAYALLESLRLLIFTPFQTEKTGLQKTLIMTKAAMIFTSALLFTFVFNSPYAGPMAATTSELIFGGIVLGLSNFTNYYKGVPKHATVAEKNKLKELNSARTKENLFRSALTAATVVGAALMFVPGLQLVGAGILIAVPIISFIDNVFVFPFPWRKAKVELKKETKAMKANFLNTIDEEVKKPVNELPVQSTKVDRVNKTSPKVEVVIMKSKYKPNFFKEVQHTVSAPTATLLSQNHISIGVR